MNVSKLIWVGSCVGGLLSYASPVKILSADDKSSALEEAAIQETTDATSKANGFEDLDKFHPVFLASQSAAQTNQGSNHPRQGAYEHDSDLDQKSPSSSFFSILSTQKEAPVNEASADSRSTMPLVTINAVDAVHPVNTVDVAIAPVARLSRKTVAQIQRDAVVAVVPSRPEPVSRPGRSIVQRQSPQRTSPQRTGLLSSLKAGTFEQCTQMIWDHSSAGNDVSVGDRPDTAATPASATVPNSSPNRVTTDSRDYRVFVNSQLVAEFPSQQQANEFAATAKTWLDDQSFDPDTIKPRVVDGNVTIASSSDTVLLSIDQTLAEYAQTTPVGVAIAWSNTLRSALGASTLDLADAQVSLQELEFTGQKLEGTASWYGPYFHGRLTASGETFDQEAMTAAHPSLPFGTYLKVTNLENQQSVVVKVNDRGPYIGERSLDLSRQAAECLGSEITGVIPYDAMILEPQPSTETPQSFMALVSQS
ncbi:MAG: septal ring lytic transglycosylase RlpA family protein [Elainellaceae cyanobacterium]